MKSITLSPVGQSPRLRPDPLIIFVAVRNEAHANEIIFRHFGDSDAPIIIRQGAKHFLALPLSPAMTAHQKLNVLSRLRARIGPPAFVDASLPMYIVGTVGEWPAEVAADTRMGFSDFGGAA